MPGAKPVNRRQQVENALLQVFENDEFGDNLQYVWVSDLSDIDPAISSSIAGQYLRQLEENSPLSSGLVVECCRDRRSGASLWTVKRVS